MATLYAKEVCDLALKQVGKSCGKTNEYSKELDKVNFYNYPKNGVADSCSIFVDDMIYRCIKEKTEHNARAAVYEPDKDNCGAGCTQAANYFKSHKAWISKASDFKKGDKIFFKKTNGAIYHTGLVVGTGSTITTVEGNTNGGKVAKKTYKATDPKIAGAGRPKYTAYERPQAEPEKPDPLPSPTPEPMPAPTAPQKPQKSIEELAREVIAGKWGNGTERAQRLKNAGYNYDAVQKKVNEILGAGKNSSKPAAAGKKYKVNVSIGKILRIRSGAGTTYPQIGKLPRGASVTVYETKGSWGRIGTGKWVSMDYLK